ncbi:unnamed protein product [Dovyalis caffra]|uniref:Uncharacterized protein n=1 Tax=Dovyalis caffra TaxID=77055 RepID=A0AAV1RXL5_9ROSI|nr:unnamed protein product [Dovyalis caffra]
MRDYCRVAVQEGSGSRMGWDCWIIGGCWLVKIGQEFVQEVTAVGGGCWNGGSRLQWRLVAGHEGLHVAVDVGCGRCLVQEGLQVV